MVYFVLIVAIEISKQICKYHKYMSKFFKLNIFVLILINRNPEISKYIKETNHAHAINSGNVTTFKLYLT